MDYVTVDGTAVAGRDYEPKSGTLVFGRRDLTKTIWVPVEFDAAYEDTETMTLRLSNPRGGQIDWWWPFSSPRKESSSLVLWAGGTGVGTWTRVSRVRNGWSEGKQASPLPPAPCHGVRLSGWKTASTTFHCNIRSWSPAFYENTSRKDSSAKKVPDKFFSR